MTSKRILSILLLLALSAMRLFPAAAEDAGTDRYADGGQLIAAAPEHPQQDEPVQDREAFGRAFRERADSGTVNHALANYSVDACALSGSKTKMAGFLGKLGFQDAAFYDYQPDGEHFAAHTVAWRFVQDGQGEDIPLFAVVIRGTVEAAEWHSNFTPGNGPEHEGFKAAEMTIRKNLGIRPEVYKALRDLWSEPL